MEAARAQRSSPLLRKDSRSDYNNREYTRASVCCRSLIIIRNRNRNIPPTAPKLHNSPLVSINISLLYLHWIALDYCTGVDWNQSRRYAIALGCACIDLAQAVKKIGVSIDRTMRETCARVCHFRKINICSSSTR